MIKFVSYTGKYPNLCSGVLTVKINGKTYKFGHESEDYDWNLSVYKDKNFEKFWKSGGCIRGDFTIGLYSIQEPWELSIDCKYPDWIIKILPELIKVFNENVKYGCCGGCI